MPWSVEASGSKTPTVNPTCTFTNGQANIAVTNTAAAGDHIILTTGGTLPTNFVAGTTYYVIATGLSGSNIQVSATIGGSAISAGSAGSGTHNVTFEHVLDTATTIATYVCSVDAKNLVSGDLVELRCYDMVDGTNYAQMWKGTYQHVQINPAKASPPVAVTTQCKFTLRQPAGTARVFPWSVRRI